MLKERKMMTRVKKKLREEADRTAEETRVNSGETKGISEMMRKRMRKMNTKKEREIFVHPCFFVFSESTCSGLSYHLPSHNPPTCQLASHLA